MKIHRFQSSTIQTIQTNQHQFNGIAERAIRTIKEKAIQNYEIAFKYLDHEAKRDSIRKWWFWSMYYAATVSNILSMTINNITKSVFPNYRRSNEYQTTYSILG